MPKLRKITRLTEDSARSPDVDSVRSRLVNRKRMADFGLNDVRTFAIEISNGAIVKVFVASKDADRFEDEVARVLLSNPDAEIGNVLYELTRFFEIYDIEWSGEFDDKAPVTEDDEEPVQASGGETPPENQGDAPPPADVNADVVNDDEGTDFDDKPVDLDSMEDMDPDAEGDVTPEDAGTLKDLLTQIVSQLSQDAQARSAEAEARKAEAEAKKAQAVAHAMTLKISQEKEVKKMEAWEDEEKEKKQREKLTDRLAKFRIAKAQGAVTDSTTLKGKPLFEAKAMRISEVNQRKLMFDMIAEGSLSDRDVARLLVRHRVREDFTLAPRMMQKVRSVTKIARANPQRNEEAFNAFQKAIEDYMTDFFAQRQQVNNELADKKSQGLQGEQLQTHQQAMKLKLNFFRRVGTLKKQLDQQLEKLNAVNESKLVRVSQLRNRRALSTFARELSKHLDI